MEQTLTKQEPKTKIIESIETEIQECEDEIDELKTKKKDLKIELQIAQKTAQSLNVNPGKGEIQEKMKNTAIEETKELTYAIQFTDKEISDLEFKSRYLQTKLGVLSDPTFYLDN